MGVGPSGRLRHLAEEQLLCALRHGEEQELSTADTVQRAQRLNGRIQYGGRPEHQAGGLQRRLELHHAVQFDIRQRVFWLGYTRILSVPAESAVAAYRGGCALSL